jgi:hypothetical protein
MTYKAGKKTSEEVTIKFSGIVKMPDPGYLYLQINGYSDFTVKKDATKLNLRWIK